jgi:mutator protein MutT
MRKAVSIALIHEGRIMVAERLTGHKRGVYSFVGGKVEEGETLEQAALREMHEEVGISCELISKVGTYKVFAEVGGFHLTVFLGINPSGEPKPSNEAGNPHFVSLDELKTYKTTEGLYEIAATAFWKRKPFLDERYKKV